MNRSNEMKRGPNICELILANRFARMLRCQDEQENFTDSGARKREEIEFEAKPASFPWQLAQVPFASSKTREKGRERAKGDWKKGPGIFSTCQGKSNMHQIMVTIFVSPSAPPPFFP